MLHLDTVQVMGGPVVEAHADVTLVAFGDSKIFAPLSTKRKDTAVIEFELELHMEHIKAVSRSS